MAKVYKFFLEKLTFMKKYRLNGNLTAAQKQKIIKTLKISERTFYRKINAETADKQGFEFFQMLMICKICDKELMDIVNLEALDDYLQTYQE